MKLPSASKELKAPQKPLRKVSRGAVRRIAVQGVGARMLVGEFAPGTPLPNEADWCRSFGVGRTAGRAAIKMLMGRGLVPSRPRVGSRALPRGQWTLLDRDVLCWHVAGAKQSHFLADMRQVREILEPETAAPAAADHSPGRLRAIDDASRRWPLPRPSPPGTTPTSGSTSRSCRPPATRSWRRSASSSNPRSAACSPTPRARRAMSAAPYPHQRILAAIRARRPDAARRAVRELLGDSSHVVGEV